MSIQEAYLIPFVDGVQTLAERFIQVSQFDKTITAEIVETDPDNKHHYLVSTTGYSRISVYTFENDDTIYKLKDTVYVSIPNGDFSNNSKYIIGKTNRQQYSSAILALEDILVSPYQQKTMTDNTIYINNANKYSTIIIEFTPRIELSLADSEQTNILLQETAFTFTIKGTRKNNTYTTTSIWTTKNLYGNIFSNLIPNKQRIILSELQNFEEIEITWDKVLQNDIPIMTYQNQITDNKATITLSNFVYSYGYDIANFDKNENNGVVLVETYNGPKLFCRNSYYFQNLEFLESQLGKDAIITYNDYNDQWPNQEEAYDYIVKLQAKYSGNDFVQIQGKWNSFPVDLKALSTDNNNWYLQIYKKDYISAEPESNEAIPPFWKKIKEYDNMTNSNIENQIYDSQYVDSDQENTLVALVYKRNDTNYTKTTYDFLE